MTNYERIKGMTPDELNKFLWWWKISSVASFLSHGGQRLMDSKQQRAWLDGTEWDCDETRQVEGK